ncbi:MAG: DsbA family oxidoreductase [Mycobacterium sp.]
MKVEIWSDVVCPWCYIGKRHLEEALTRFSRADQVTVEWRSFELDPGSPVQVGLTMSHILQRKYGMNEDQADAANARMTELAAGVGLEYHLDRVQAGNTFDAHRLIHLAATHGRADAMKERLLAAYFTEVRSIGDPAVLTELAIEVGIDPSEVATTLHSDAFASEVRLDESRATSLGVRGVPFFVIDGSVSVSGAQPADVLVRALGRAWSESRPTTLVDDAGEDLMPVPEAPAPSEASAPQAPSMP